MTRPTIAITMGDPAGIGPEIIMKALAHPEVHALCRPLVIGDAGRLRQAGRIVGATIGVDSLADAGAAGDVAELRELLHAWRDAKRSAWRALAAWVVRVVLALLLAGIAMRLGLDDLLKPGAGT